MLLLYAGEKKSSGSWLSSIMKSSKKKKILNWIKLAVKITTYVAMLLFVGFKIVFNLIKFAPHGNVSRAKKYAMQTTLSVIDTWGVEASARKHGNCPPPGKRVGSISDSKDSSLKNGRNLLKSCSQKRRQAWGKWGQLWFPDDTSAIYMIGPTYRNW